MRRLTLLLVMVLGVSLQVGAQQFVAPTRRSTSNVDSTTTYTYKMSDNIYKVYKSRTGAYYVWKISKKTNKKYRMYLPKEIQINMGRKYEIISK
nr:MAG TPA: hypothetical protein [Crassvirales sp.]